MYNDLVENESRNVQYHYISINNLCVQRFKYVAIMTASAFVWIKI